jgi:hypothetical protein
MTPIAAYFLFTAAEQERAAAAAHGIAGGRPSLLGRLRALVAFLRSEPIFSRQG